MKVLFIGSFDSQSTNISQVDAFERAGCKVLMYDYKKPLSGAKGEASYHEVVELRKSFDPQLVLFSKCREFPLWVMDAYEDVIKVLWYMDPVNGNYTQRLVDLMRRSNLVYCNIWEAAEKSQSLGIPAAQFLQEGFDRTVDRPMPVDEKFDVSFIGCPRGERAPLCQAVGAEVIRGAYREEHARAVCRSRINLNFTEGGSSDRSYKVMAAGGFLLTQPWPHMEDDFSPEVDLDIFKSEKDLKTQVKKYLAHPRLRRSIAWSGNRTVQKFTRDAWVARILTDAEGV